MSVAWLFKSLHCLFNNLFRPTTDTTPKLWSTSPLWGKSTGDWWISFSKGQKCRKYYSDIIMSAMASQIINLMIVYSTIYSGTDQRKLQSSMSLAFVWGIHRWPVNSPYKGPVTLEIFPFDDVVITVIKYCGTISLRRQEPDKIWYCYWTSVTFQES